MLGVMFIDPLRCPIDTLEGFSVTTKKKKKKQEGATATKTGALRLEDTRVSAVTFKLTRHTTPYVPTSNLNRSNQSCTSCLLVRLMFLTLPLLLLGPCATSRLRCSLGQYLQHPGDTLFVHPHICTSVNKRINKGVCGGGAAVMRRAARPGIYGKDAWVSISGHELARPGAETMNKRLP